MTLYYLDFDFSEDEGGNACWDALASVTPQHWAALLTEVDALLTWCAAQGEPGDLDAGRCWDFDLQAMTEGASSSTAIALAWTPAGLQCAAPLPEAQRRCLSLTISGNPAFASAFEQHWHID